MQEFIVPITYFTVIFKVIVGLFAAGMIFIWPRIDASTSRMNLEVFKYGGMAFWSGLTITHIFEAYRLLTIAMNDNIPPPFGVAIFLYAFGGLLKAGGLPVVVFTAVRWARLRIVSPAVANLVDKMIDEAENELAKHAREGAATLEREPGDMDAPVGVSPKPPIQTSATSR